MSALENDIAIAERHVRDGEELIARQIQMIHRLEHGGYSTHEAEQLLLELREMQAGYTSNLEQLRSLR